MAKKYFGNLSNRIAEGHFYGEDKTIREGTDITMYHWSDRSCFFVTSVVDQKHIFVKPYRVCADHSKQGGMGHQNWLYFKTDKECNMYLNTVLKNQDYDENPVETEPEEWAFRYNKWKRVSRSTVDGKEVIKYNSLPANISFGVKDYYMDWEF